MADSVLIAGELEQQSETLKLIIRVLGQHTVGVLFLVQDVLQELLGDQRQFQVPLITGVVVEYVVDNIVGVEVFVLAFRVKGQAHSAGQPHRGAIGYVSVLIEGCLGIVAVFEAETHLVFLLTHGFSSLSGSSEPSSSSY